MRWIVMTSVAPQKGGGFGPYNNVASVLITDEYATENLKPKTIRWDAHGIVAIIHHGSHFVGKTEKSAIYRALAKANQLADDLNTLTLEEQLQYLISWKAKQLLDRIRLLYE